MYRKMKLIEELRELKQEIRKGNACQAIINRIFEIEMILDNIYYTD